MGREVRRVPADWEHPTWDDDGGLKPLHEECAEPKKEFNYMPNWTEEEKTHIQMYETCTEGTPISPVMDTPENLAKWLADNNASSFGMMTATYEQWLNMIQNTGHAISGVMVNGVMKSGVEYSSDK